MQNKDFKTEYFTRFPNEYIQCDIKEKFGINRKFYITYILIDRYRSYEGYSWITIRKVMEFYGYKTFGNKPKAFVEVLDVLKYMVENKMIEVAQDLDSVSYDTGIEIKIISENFDCRKRFSRFTSSQFKAIMSANTEINKESLLMVFLYVNSYIGSRLSLDSSPINGKKNNNPEVFWKSVENMARELSMSKSTISQCLNYLSSSSEGHKALLVKEKMPVNGLNIKRFPYIYVLNKDGYQSEIEYALTKIKEVYGEVEF